MITWNHGFGFEMSRSQVVAAWADLELPIMNHRNQKAAPEDSTRESDFLVDGSQDLWILGDLQDVITLCEALACYFQRSCFQCMLRFFIFLPPCCLCPSAVKLAKLMQRLVHLESQDHSVTVATMMGSRFIHGQPVEPTQAS